MAGARRIRASITNRWRRRRGAGCSRCTGKLWLKERMKSYRWIAIAAGSGLAAAFLLQAAKTDGLTILTGQQAFSNTLSLKPGEARKITAAGSSASRVHTVGKHSWRARRGAAGERDAAGSGGFQSWNLRGRRVKYAAPDAQSSEWGYLCRRYQRPGRRQDLPRHDGGWQAAAEFAVCGVPAGVRDQFLSAGTESAMGCM